MKLFRLHRSAAGPAIPPKAEPAPQSPPDSVPPPVEPQPTSISLSSEQKGMLAGPVDPRVEQILRQIYADKELAEKILKERRIVDFPRRDSGEHNSDSGTVLFDSL